MWFQSDWKTWRKSKLISQFIWAHGEFKNILKAQGTFTCSNYSATVHMILWWKKYPLDTVGKIQRYQSTLDLRHNGTLKDPWGP